MEYGYLIFIYLYKQFFAGSEKKFYVYISRSLEEKNRKMRILFVGGF